MSRLFIRDARPADANALVALETAAFASDRMSRRSLRRMIDAPTAALRVATREGALAGYALLLFRSTSAVARLYSVAVAEAHAGTGVGSALMRDAETVAARSGSRVLRLEVRTDNRRAIRLYDGLGYAEVARLPAYYADGDDGLRLEKPLARRRRTKVTTPAEDRSLRDSRPSRAYIVRGSIPDFGGLAGSRHRQRGDIAPPAP